MTVDSHFAVAVDRQGSVCTLPVSSDLDFTPAERLTQQAACLDATIGQLVLDLSPLRFAVRPGRWKRSPARYPVTAR